MNKAGAALIMTGVIGTVAGIGYAVASHRRRSDTAETSEASEASDVAETRPSRIPRPDTPTPTDAPKHPKARQRINWSHVTNGTVDESPATLLAQARRYDASISLDELTGARLIASEHSTGTFSECACIVDAELNRARRRGRSLYESLTYRDTFGKQGKHRLASTRRDPKMRHLLAARAVLSGKHRGISRGATRFFDPLAMERMNRRFRAWLAGGKVGDKPPSVSCDALTLLEVWSFDYAKKGGYRCPPDRTRTGRHPLAWVGPIYAVNPLKLLLMKPLARGPEHTRLYESARDTISRALAKV